MTDDVTTSGTPISGTAPATPGTPVTAQSPNGVVPGSPGATSPNAAAPGSASTTGQVTIESQEGMRTVIAAIRKFSERANAAKKAGEGALAQVVKSATSPDSGEVSTVYSGVTDAFGSGVSNVNSNVDVVSASAVSVAGQLEHVLEQLLAKDDSTASAVRGIQA